MSPRVAPVDNIRDFAPTSARPQFEQRSGGAVRFEKPAESYPVESYVGSVENPESADGYPRSDGISPVGNVGTVLSEPAPAQQAVQEASQMFHQPAMRPIPTSAEMRRDQSQPPRSDGATIRGFFKRVADAGRALSGRQDIDNDKEYQEPQEPRVQVVQKPSQGVASPERPNKVQDQDQYLDIPAFLRRQAN